MCVIRALHILWLLGVLLCTRLQAQAAPAMPGTPADAGEQVCLTCHAQTSSYLHTAHQATSSLASKAALGQLLRLAGQDLMITRDPFPTLAFRMEEKEGSFTETAVTGWKQDLLRTSGPMDIIVGSGKRGQTFLGWSDNQLFELPVSYWKEGHRWINSPGYVDGTADFHRPVQPGCLECHVTSIVPSSADAAGNRYKRASLVTGIGCARCHGAAEAHVKVEQAAAKSGTRAPDSMILNPAHFSRERQLDLCAVCHSGVQRVALQPAFSYVPGEPLARYFKPLPTTDGDRPDVHGNQVGLLERSRCFRESAQLTCSTCHEVHTALQPAALYASRCMTCHAWQDCGQAKKIGATVKGKCIGCHMPLQKTEAIISVTAGQTVQATMRTHWIKVYPPNAKDTRQD